MNKDAKTLMNEVAQDPSLDEFFARCPRMDPEKKRAMLLKARADRASWGQKK